MGMPKKISLTRLLFNNTVYNKLKISTLYEKNNKLNQPLNVSFVINVIYSPIIMVTPTFNPIVDTLKKKNC